MTVSDELLRTCVDRWRAEVAIVDSDGTIQYTNDAWRDFAVEGGFPGDPAMLGEDYFDAIRASRDEDRYAAAAIEGFESLLEAEMTEFSLEYPCPAPDVPFRWFLCMATPVSHGGNTYLTIQHIEITYRKRIERRLEARNALLENVGSILSHDLHNPLGAALAWLEVIAAADEPNPSHLQRLESALTRMDEIIDDALFLARGLNVEETETVILEQVARDAWAVTGRETATLTVGDVPPIEANQRLFQSLLENLFRNAVEHAGPAVTVRIGRLDQGFFVEDDGSGIPTNEHESVFKTGFTTRATEKNTGMGLPIVVAIANAHEWDLELSTSSDGGARFEVTGVQPGSLE